MFLLVLSMLFPVGWLAAALLRVVGCFRGMLSAALLSTVSMLTSNQAPHNDKHKEADRQDSHPSEIHRRRSTLYSLHTCDLRVHCPARKLFFLTLFLLLLGWSTRCRSEHSPTVTTPDHPLFTLITQNCQLASTNQSADACSRPSAPIPTGIGVAWLDGPDRLHAASFPQCFDADSFALPYALARITSTIGIHSSCCGHAPPSPSPSAFLYAGMISAQDLYVRSIVRHRAAVHRQLYGQYAFSLVRHDLTGTTDHLLSALYFSSALCFLFWCIPAAYLYWLSSFLSYEPQMIFARSPFNRVRALRARKHRRACTCHRLLQHTLKSAVITYLLLFYLHTDASSGRKHWAPSQPASKKSQRRRCRKLPYLVAHVARWCENLESSFTTRWHETCLSLAHNIDICYIISFHPYMLALYACFPLYNDSYGTYLIEVIQTMSFGLIFAYVFLPLALIMCNIVGLTNFTRICFEMLQRSLPGSLTRHLHSVLSRLAQISTTASSASMQTLKLAAPFKLEYMVVLGSTLFCYISWAALLLLRCGDIERNPGPNSCNQYIRPVPVIRPATIYCFIVGLLIDCLLLRSGDIHPNPGPTIGHTPSTPSHAQQSPLIKDHLNILNWNCRGIDSKLAALPQFLDSHDIHIAVLTETRRAHGTHRASNELRSGNYTLHFSSHIDTSHTVSYIPNRAREWGVCIAVRTGLAYQPVQVPATAFQARLQHGTLKIPTPSGELIDIDILGAYAPANPEHKPRFWEALLGYIQKLATGHANAFQRHLIIAGDWNSYIDLERDIYRTDPPDASATNNSAPVQYLTGFLADLRANNSPLYDPMAQDKLTAINDFTFSTRNHSYRSIPDKVFTSFPPDHCEPSTIFDWTDTRSLGLSDHRPVCTRVSLARLCQGWLEYPSEPLSRPRIKIDPKTLTPEHESSLHTAVAAWKQTLSPSMSTWLLQDRPQPQLAAPDDLTTMHTELCKLFVEIPSLIYATGSHASGSGIYKTRSAGQTQ